MLSSGREAHSSCCSGSLATRCKLCLHLVRMQFIPRCQSEAYRPSYDPDFSDWEFGKLSALREIAFTLEGAYQYYYMGTFTINHLMSRNLLIKSSQVSTSILARRCATRLHTGPSTFWVRRIAAMSHLDKYILTWQTRRA